MRQHVNQQQSSFIQGQQTFFKFIETYFGTNIKILMKKWIKLKYRIMNNKLHIYFIKRCIDLSIIPNHLINNFSKLPRLTHYNNYNKMRYAVLKVQIKISKVELNDANRKLEQSTKALSIITKQIFNNVPYNILQTFVSSQESKIHKYYLKKKTVMIKKIYNLEIKQKYNVKPIRYYAYRKDNTNQNTETINKRHTNFHKTFDFKSDPIHNITPTNTINIKPEEFIDKVKSNTKLVNNWFINLSGKEIPIKIAEIVQLGERFTLPSRHLTNKVIIETIKDTENNIRKYNPVIKSEVRNYISTHLKKLTFNNRPLTNIERELLNKAKTTSLFLKNNPDIIFTRADKGNTTVALRHSDYIHQINTILQDTNTYTLIQKNPVKQIENQLTDLLNRWTTRGYINNVTKNSLKTSDSILPRAYGVPKIHKENYPFRLIVSTMNSPLHKFALFLHKIVHDSIPHSPFYVKDSFSLYNKLSGLEIEEDHVLCSLDVVSLFTNVPMELALEGIKKRWRHIRLNTKISLEELLLGLRLVMSSTYFTFDNKIYKQTFGTPMGSPLSPIMADITMQDIELKALNRLKISIPFYYRYVDDIAMALPKDRINDVLETFNSFHPRIQFTFELQTDNSLGFLDIRIINKENVISCDWYHKPTYSGRYLNYTSCNPKSHKIGTISTLVDRAILLSDPVYHQKNLVFAIETLINNNYPINFIFDTINRKLKTLFATKLNNNYRRQHESENISYFVVPYVPTIMDDMNQFFKNLTSPTDTQIRLAHRNVTQLRKYIKTHKDKIPHQKQKNVVYDISCSSCDKNYIGQTKRQLNTRINEHKRYVLKNQKETSVIAEHCLNTGHSMNWDTTNILDIEPNYFKRSISEMIHIKMNDNSLNLMRDTELLDEIYLPIIDKLKNN